jgi:LuxR family maltose regulon positive regulatory protein
VTDELLQTKLYFPRVRPSLVPRPRLIEKLNAGLGGVLTLVSAPAGFGKTTLIAKWLSKQSLHNSRIHSSQFSWLSLDEADNDPGRFFTYVIAALQAIDGNIGRGASRLLQTPQLIDPAPQLAAVVADLINDTAPLEGVGLVLDDYHTINNEAIHRTLGYWLDNAPPHFRLVIISRADPPLPLARLRVGGELVEIGGDDLRFTASETAEFLNSAMKLDLAPADITVLEARTEGWIASLQLAALSLQEQADPHAFVESFRGDNRHVMDYLVGEVLGRQPGYVRDFLLQTAVLKRLSVQLCNAVTGQVGSQQILEDLDQRNLFVIPLDDQRHWYRYHHLFAEFLQAQLERSAPDQIGELHRRAARWYEDNGAIEDAVDHALAAQDYALAGRLLTAHAERLFWHHSQIITLARWLGQLPAGVLQAEPRLFLVYGWSLMLSGQLDTLEQHLSEAAFPDAPLDVQGELATIQGELALYRLDVGRALEWFREAVSLLTPANVLARSITRQAQGYAYRLEGDLAQAVTALKEAVRLTSAADNAVLWLFANTDLAEVRLVEGRLGEAEAIFRQTLDSMTKGEQTERPIVANAYVGLGNVLREQNKLEAAAASLERGIELSLGSGYGSVARNAYTILARVRQAQGNGTEAQELMEQATSLARQTASPWLDAQLATFQARLWLAEGGRDGLAQQARNTFASEEVLASIPSYQRHMAQTVYAWALLAGGEVETAAALLKELRPQAERAGWKASLIELQSLTALTLWTLNDRPGALSALAGGFALAAPQGFVRAILDLGGAILPLLHWAARNRETAGHARLLLLEAGESPLSPASELVEPLTDRELEILRLMGQGLSNREIGERLYIALGTVGKHSSNIFAKLDAANRAEAVLRARELNLL